MIISEGAKEILQKLKSCGFEAYVVGGAVRNFCLGLPVHDYDFTTSATPEEILGVFSNYNAFAPGIKHGTVCVEKDKTVYEITTFRADGFYADSRHPTSVTFVRNLKEDLKRRDFTINAMCFDGENITDIFGGMEDCKNKLIRAIGDATTRFEEDALRILRALRFASRLGFTIEENTKNAIFARKSLLNNISAERIAVELEGILLGKNCQDVLLDFNEVITEIIPELKPTVNFKQFNRHHAFDVYTHTVRATALAKRDFTIRLACLLHDLGKVETFFRDENGEGHFYGHAEKSAFIAQKVVDRLKLSNEIKKEVLTLVKYHDYPIVPTNVTDIEKYVLRSLNRFGESTLRNLIEVKRADNLSKYPDGERDTERVKNVQARLSDLNRIEETLNEIILKGECFGLKQLKVNGNDIASLGYKGKQIGAVLQSLLDAVIDGKVQNEYTALCNYAKKCRFDA